MDEQVLIATRRSLHGVAELAGGFGGVRSALRGADELPAAQLIAAFFAEARRRL